MQNDAGIDYVSIGKRIQAELDKHQKTQSRLSDETGIDKATINKIVKGSAENSKIETYVLISNNLGMSLDNLVFGDNLSDEYSRKNTFSTVMSFIVGIDNTFQIDYEFSEDNKHINIMIPYNDRGYLAAFLRNLKEIDINYRGNLELIRKFDSFKEFDDPHAKRAQYIKAAISKLAEAYERPMKKVLHLYEGILNAEKEGNVETFINDNKNDINSSKHWLDRETKNYINDFTEYNAEKIMRKFREIYKLKDQTEEQ